ncbi:MAG: ParB/RepB/Spo0J family partition protein [Duganella sp.]
MKTGATAQTKVSPGLPLLLALDAIDEDPQQPRAADSPGFAAASLRELAQSIKRRGIKTPISVREHRTQLGRYIINHGARRLRAARLAGLAAVPVFVDNDYNEADQVIENLHRNDLTAREIADYIGRELARGLRRKEIAQRISKSAAYITQHAVLLDLPEPVAQAFNAGRVRDVTLVNDLVQAYKTGPQFVASWLSDPGQEITRGAVRMLREFLSQPEAGAGADEEGVASFAAEVTSMPLAGSRTDAFNGVLVLLHGAETCELLPRRRPSSAQLAWVRYGDGRCAEVAFAQLLLSGWRIV